MTSSGMPGGGTRQANAGDRSTSFAVSTMPVAETAASHPATRATDDHLSNAATASPATWATAINGTARRFSSGPAIVIRENDVAATGVSASSTASDARM